MPHTHPLPAGVVTPLVTFLDARGEPDLSANTALVDFQVDAGVQGVLAVGSTGELGNLSARQRVRATEVVVAAARGRVPVWAGVCGLGTTDTVEAAREAAAAGADALLVLPPLFFDCSDSELARHFGLVADAVEIPIIAYDVPPRTPRKLPTALIASLARHGVLHGVKDSSGDLVAGRLTVEATRDVEGFMAYAGSEITIDAALMLGFDGVVPGFANVAPAPAVEIAAAVGDGDLDAARRAQAAYIRLFDVLGVPLDGAGGPAAAVNALKSGTAHVLGLGLTSMSPPLTQPSGDFSHAVAGIVDTTGFTS